MQDLQEDGSANGVDQRQNRTGEQEGRNLALCHGPHQQESALRVGGQPLAEGAAQLWAGGGDVIRGHYHGHEVQQEGEQATHRTHGGAGEIGDPRGLDIVEDFHAKIADLRHLERGVLVRELTNLLIHCRQTADHGNHLLYEHIAEQREQHTHDHGHAHQTDGGSHATLPAMSHQRHHQRFDGQRQEQRDDDVEHQIGDVAPRAPAEHEHDDGEGHIQQRAAEPFRWPAGISLGGEQSTKVDTILVVRVCPGFCGTGSRRVGAVYVSRAFTHGSPL